MVRELESAQCFQFKIRLSSLTVSNRNQFDMWLNNAPTRHQIAGINKTKLVKTQTFLGLSKNSNSVINVEISKWNSASLCEGCMPVFGEKTPNIPICIFDSKIMGLIPESRHTLLSWAKDNSVQNS